MMAPERVLMTIDAVGGVWRYAMDLAAGLAASGVKILFVGFGPQPGAARIAEAHALGELVWLNHPLDWMAKHPSELDGIAPDLDRLAAAYDIDLLHLNLPSQAVGLKSGRPTVVVSHSCVVTWFAAVRGSQGPDEWAWHEQRNRAGFDAADLVMAPSRSHADLLKGSYGQIRDLVVVHNAATSTLSDHVKDDIVLAAGRWWDDGKNGKALDEAAASTMWPVLMAGAQHGPNGQSIDLRHARALGELSHDETGRLMARAGILASPSLYEPFGLAALEGASAGAALVLSDIPTYRELWGGAAMFADPRNPASFAEAINLLACEPALRRQLGARASARARTFTIEAQSRAVLDVYAAALARSATQTEAA